uniref:Uncharacterized protein n=1 Tax=Stegastes partitus TaxID=144197 RepID=A0A3B5AQ38_9TELE
MEFVSLALDITQTALAVCEVAASASPTDRQSCLPSWCCVYPLRPRIDPSSFGYMAFAKIPRAACGCAGIFTYELLSSSTRTSTEQIAVMFKVPFDQNLKSNAYAVGVFDISKECNRYLFQDMTKGLDTTFIRGKAKVPVLIHRSRQVTIMAAISMLCHKLGFHNVV